MMAVGILIILVGVPFAYWTISPFFRIANVNDTAPESVVASTTTEHGPYVVVPTAAHPASGTLKVIKTAAGTVLRYENYQTLNGPDLRLYLATDLKASDYIDLGDLKGTRGNINYEVPGGTDLTKYRYVLTWCRAFSVLFNSVDISES